MIQGVMKLRLLNLVKSIFPKMKLLLLLLFNGCVMDLTLSEVVVQNNTGRKILLQLQSRDSLLTSFELDSGENRDFSPCNSYCNWFEFLTKNDSAVVVISDSEEDSLFVIKADILDSIGNARRQRKSFEIVIE